jgi:hypothetical protein
LCKTWWGNLRERDHLEDPGVEGKIILKWNFRKCDGGKGGMDWIDLAQVRDMWWALENAAMYFWFYKMRRISWLTEDRLTSQEGLCSID